MALDPRGRFLHVGCRDRQQLSSYRIEPATGGLSLIGTVPLEGEPVQIVTDRTGRYVLSVFFYQSRVGVHAINDQGQIASTPIESRETAYGCHGVEVDRSNRYLFVPHVARSGGPNGITQFRFDQRDRTTDPQHASVPAAERQRGAEASARAPHIERGLLVRRAGLQRHRLSPRRIDGHAHEDAEHLHSARRLHGEGISSRVPNCSSTPTGDCCSSSPACTTASRASPSTRRRAD